MKLGYRIALGTAVGAGLCRVVAAYARDLHRARRMVASGGRMVETASGPIEYAEAGDGAPVLVIHGAGGGYDQGLVLGRPLVRRGFRVIAPSRFGYLHTPLPRDASAEAQADAHAALLDALGIERVAVMGVSAGGPSALQFCLRHPRRCTALVLLVPLAYSAKALRELSPAAKFLMDKSLSSDFLFWFASRFLRARMVQAILGTPIAAVRALPPGEQREVYAVLDDILPVSLRANGLINDSVVAQSLRPLPLERIAVPTLIASVEDDGYQTLAGARYTAEHIPGARLITYPTGGHLWVGHQQELGEEIATMLARPPQAARAGAGLEAPMAR